MKILIKIEEYLPESQQVVVRFCSSQSEKSIDEAKLLAFDLDKLVLHDTDSFLDSLAIYGRDVIENYEQIQYGESIENGPLDISNLVDRTIERDQFPRGKKMIPMKRIEL